jgi:hypothetical protein
LSGKDKLQSLQSLKLTTFKETEIKMQITNATTGQIELTIDTTTPAITAEEIMLSADRRGKELSDAERIRRVVLPAKTWGSLAATENLKPLENLAAVLEKALIQIASARLRETLEENPLARTVAAADYSISSLLAWNAATSKQGASFPYSREELETWFATSATAKKYTPKGEAVLQVVKETIAKLAARNHGIKTTDQANRVIGWLDTAVSADDPIASALVEKLGNIITVLEEKTSKAPSMDAID